MPYRSFFLFALITAIGIAPSTSVLRAHEGEHHEHDHAPTETARGVVFDDANKNGKRDEGEPGLAGIKVSNGKEIVKTDGDGRYAIEVDSDTILFVIKPRNWQVPMGENQLPQFYYIHKPAGSPPNFKFAGVKPTGPLPKSIDFPLHRNQEPDKFKAILFGDPQPSNIKEVEYIAHDVVEQIIAAEGHDASFGVTLGDIVFDDLSVMQPLNQAIALIGIPWYNVIGNHDLNLDAPDDKLSDETFESIYGPTYYSFDHGPAHFLVLDDVVWVAAHDGKKAHYHGGLGEKQIEFVKNDLAGIPEDQLVVLLMHVPIQEVKDRQDLYRLIEQRPATVSISAHRHFIEHRLIGKEDGWRGKEKHHHIINVTVSGSWWRGQKDERGIPHATMSDGAPNGYSIMEFDGNKYRLEFRAAGRPAEHQMNIYAPEVVAKSKLAETTVTVNVFGGADDSQVSMRIGQGDWISMKQSPGLDPGFMAEKEREAALKDRTWTELPSPHQTRHLWKATLPSSLGTGTHLIEVRAIDRSGKEAVDQRIIRVK